MEVLAILIGIIFWPIVIITWCIYIRKRKLARWIKLVGLVLVIGMPVLAAASMGKYMFLDEPLVFAVRDGDIAKVKSLLAYGADPNASFKGDPALEQAAAEGQTEIVRLLLSHGARTDTENEESKRTALAAAEQNNYPEVVKLLKKAGATH